MKLLTTIFKLLSAVSFLLLMIPDEKFNIPMWMALLALIFGAGSFIAMIFSLLIVIAFAYLFTTAFEFTRLNDWFGVTAILIFYFPLFITIRKVFIHPVFISWLTYSGFFTTSLITLVLTIRRLRRNNYNNLN